ncbi:hypothetical protein [Nonomuraea antimicrobica]|uniref:hypothetical protein n=1 Tax=Nonomuraea antimicrobica TaxID=561173 RepID=UPI0031EC2C42
MAFTVLAALSGMEREYIRDRTLEGHESGRARGKAVASAAVTDEHMLSMALHLRDQDLSLRETASRPVITQGAEKGRHPPRPPSCACSATTTPASPSWMREPTQPVLPRKCPNVFGVTDRVLGIEPEPSRGYHGVAE